MAVNVVADSIASMLQNYNSYFAFIGAISVSFVALKFVASVWSGFKAYVLSPMLGLGADLKSFGSWAVVTGSTDGIGKLYAFELARRGINVVLISRSADKLKVIAQEIESKYHVSTKCVAIDFTGDIDIYDEIAEQLRGLEVGILVNNVGMGYDFPHFLTELATNQDYAKLINVNCNGVTLMTRLILPQMVERKKGVVINISSFSGAIPTPLLTVYSATKAYVDFFSRGVQAEYSSKGIIVQSVLPGFVATKMSKIRKASLMAPSPESYVRSALSTVGVESRTFGYWTHALQALLTIGILPESMYNRLTISVMLGARARGLKKQEKKE